MSTADETIWTSFGAAALRISVAVVVNPSVSRSAIAIFRQPSAMKDTAVCRPMPDKCNQRCSWEAYPKLTIPEAAPVTKATPGKRGMVVFKTLVERSVCVGLDTRCCCEVKLMARSS